MKCIRFDVCKDVQMLDHDGGHNLLNEVHTF